MDLPPDPALGPPPLTDPAAVADLLAASVPGPVGPVRLRYLEHEVGSSILAQHRAEVGGHQLDVVLSRHRRRWPTPTPTPADPAIEAVALLARAGVVRPAVTVAGVTVAWYPFDPGLPLLAGDLTPLVPAAARPPAGTVWRRLAWVPQQRAVLAAGATVVKLEADPARVAAGVRGLDLLRPVVTVPAVLAVDEAAGVYVQERLAGQPLGPPDALAWARSAGALAARIAAASVPSDRAAGGLPVVGPDELLAATAPAVRLVTQAAPDLTSRVTAVVDRLRAAAPERPDLAPAHGDFNAGQLLARARGGLGLVDTDTLCLAPVGHDLAAYAANLVAGRTGDLAACDAAVAGLLPGFGPAPSALPWLVAVATLRRLDRPIRRYKPRWRARVDQHLADVEALAARCRPR